MIKNKNHYYLYKNLYFSKTKCEHKCALHLHLQEKRNQKKNNNNPNTLI